ncbi:MAG: pirin family protein [bacterium]|nr:pirin family protein [bacterium]
MNSRSLDRTLKAQEVFEGGGVRLRRGFSNVETGQFDPFLLFDDFSSNVPEHYLAGFPWHPHRGMETVTYILDGAVRHKDSLGNEGVIESGAIQWMTAGSGIIHEEMPESTHGIRGFQLWVNLPQKNKMMPPRYQDLRGAMVPEVGLGKSARVKVISGNIGGAEGPLKSVAGNPLYIDVTLEANGSVSILVTSGHTAFAYLIEGGVAGDAPEPTYYAPGTILLFNREGDTLSLRAGRDRARFLVISGEPLNEPIAWHGPIVMNTDEELREAFRELREGGFIRPA